MAERAAIYRTRPGVIAEAIGDLWAVYSPASGDTTLLNDEAAAYLELLSERPRDPADAARVLAAEIEADPDIVGAHVVDAFHALENSGLIEAISADDPDDGP